MALPKEPRQKMINMMYLVLTALLALNVSSEILNAFKIVDKSLKGSNANITTANNVLYKDLTDKLTDPQQGANAKIWQPVAEKGKKLSDDLYTMIENYKMQLKKEAGGEATANDSTYKEDNLDAATRLFDPAGEGKKLFDAMSKYRSDLLGVHPEVKQNFEKILALNIPEADAKEWSIKNFHMVPTVAALTILSKLQNDVKNSENQVASYCDSKLGQVKVQFDSYATIVGQSTEYTMPGGNIKIRGGVGAFSKSAQPKVTIDGSPVSINAEGFAEIEKPAGGSGSHSSTVSITYTTQSGETKTETKKVEWTVGQPSGAAVYLEKMNVLYIGVPNPLSIAGGAGAEKTSASISQGRLDGAGQLKYNAYVSTEGTATITVRSGEQTTPVQFRVKMLPPATVYCAGQKSGPVQSALIKAQGGLSSKLEGSDFDAAFEVVSYKVTVNGKNGYQEAQNSGNRWSGAAAALINSCAPGSSVTFENVKIKGPDGRVRSATNEVLSFYLR
jgi:gliding motility-associated protein GldM